MRRATDCRLPFITRCAEPPEPVTWRTTTSRRLELDASAGGWRGGLAGGRGERAGGGELSSGRGFSARGIRRESG